MKSKRILLAVYRECGKQLLEDIKSFHNATLDANRKYYQMQIIEKHGRYEMCVYLIFNHFIENKRITNFKGY